MFRSPVGIFMLMHMSLAIRDPNLTMGNKRTSTCAGPPPQGERSFDLVITFWTEKKQSDYTQAEQFPSGFLEQDAQKVRAKRNKTSSRPLLTKSRFSADDRDQ